MIKTINNLINENEYEYLNGICKSFSTSDNPNTDEMNYYLRNQINGIYISDYVNTINEYVKVNYGENYRIVSNWINKVTPDTNKNDEYHKDNSNLTMVTFLNENFKGGEFQYVNVDNMTHHKIQPKIGLTLIMDDRLPHRVRPVKMGERFSLVTFFKISEKKNTTLI